jgi:hypothetical protein
MNEVYLIQYFDAGPQSSKMISKLIDAIEERGKKFIITSHSIVSHDILRRCSGYFYDPQNFLYEVNSDYFFFKQLGDFILTSPYLFYGSISHRSHAIAAFTNFTNGLNLAKQLGFDIVHCVEYDCIPNFDDLDDNRNLIERKKCSSVVYKDENSTIFGGVFTVSVSPTIQTNITLEEIRSYFSKFNDFSEIAFYEKIKEWADQDLLLEKNKSIQAGSSLNNLGSIELETVIVEDQETGNLILVIVTGSNKNHFDVKCYCNINFVRTDMNPNSWQIVTLGKKEEITFVDIYLDRKLYRSWDISSYEKYQEYVSRNSLERVIQ